jgi:arsenate reductase
MQKRILFICVHNSARSQIAEALMHRQCGDDVQVESAGLTPGTLNPLAVEVLKEIGIDISGKATRDVLDVYKSGKLFSDVITVCDQASAERYPIFPGALRRLHWSFADPSTFEGTWEEKLEMTRKVRDEIQEKIKEWCEAYCESLSVIA